MTAVTVCVSNVVNHKLAETLVRLQRAGIEVRLESCLNNCGPCRHAAFCVQDGCIRPLAELLDDGQV